MDDRELLELAAKASGLWDEKNNCIDTPWSPLLDDGDALRLAVKCGMGFLYETQESMGGTIIEVSYDMDEDEGTCKVVTEALESDPYAATRRAIVRAAAEIGRAMP